MMGAFLAEWADVVDNKLQVSGAVLSTFATGVDRSVNIAVVLLTQADDAMPSTSGRHAKSADGQQLSILEVEITQPTGQVTSNGLELPRELNDSEVGCVFFPLELVLPFDGRHEIVFTCNEVRISLPLTITTAAPPAGYRSLING
jgi:hypothetical protein